MNCNPYDESLRLRISDRDRADELTRGAPPAAGGAPGIVAVVYDAGAIPTAAGNYFACRPATPFGAESEGGAGTVTPDTSKTIYVLVEGGAPQAADVLVAHFIGGRWVAGFGAPVVVAVGQTDSVGVAARSGTTAGTGVFYAVTINTSTGALTTASTPLGGTPCWNISSTAVAPNAYIMLKRVGGVWWVDMESCS